MTQEQITQLVSDINQSKIIDSYHEYCYLYGYITFNDFISNMIDRGINNVGGISIKGDTPHLYRRKQK